MLQDRMPFPRLILSALRGGSGKTVLSLGIIAALRKQGQPVSPFKKGPDYIDAGWLALAAGRPCYNLDTYLVSPDRVLASFLNRMVPGSIAVIEGNRGLYDGIDLEGSTSTAELAKLLQAPVILCLDATKTTRTLAAVVSGCAQFDSEVPIRGVILNRVAGARHENILRRSVETHCGIPVLGAVPKLRSQDFPERHMGLVPTPEHAWARRSIDAIGKVVQRYLDLEQLQHLAAAAPSLPPAAETVLPAPPGVSRAAALTIGVLRDSAFQFYYPENFDALIRAGAKLKFFSPLQTESLPDIDALYIGGGFPETHADALAANEAFRSRLKRRIEDGLPVYAECGGLMYLGRSLVLDESSYPMVGVLPIVYGFSRRPQGHGYTVIAVDRSNPYYDVGSQYRGHEFHYSRVLQWDGTDRDLVFRMERGAGIVDGRDGACYRNVLATYTHLHALGTPAWARALLRNAQAYHAQKERGHRSGSTNNASR
jgi:cobyrinic acid a,c-diamide synthase